jgi:hypothetical protein
MDKEPLVSVVILSFNRKEDVLANLHKIVFENEYKNLEVIIVDNASRDGTVSAVRSQYREVKVIALEENIGVAACNIGFAAASGEFVLILDDDSFPEKTAIRRMVEEFTANAQLGIVAFDVRSYADYDNLVAGNSEKNGKAIQSAYQMAFNGAGAGMRRSVLQRVGGYAEEFFLYWNEQDLALRVLHAGYDIKCFPDIISYHQYSPLNRESRRAPYFYTRNLFWLIWKYFPFWRGLRDTWQLVYFSIYSCLEQHTWVYAQAMFKAFAGFQQIRAKRLPLRSSLLAKVRLTYRIAFTYYR